jgi:alkylhydroperoxidase family enzyme
MAHVPLAEKGDRLVARLAYRYSRRRFCQVVDPVAAAAHHTGVLMAMGALETVAERGWKRLDPHLRWLAIQAAASRIGCSWCTDFGFFEGMQLGVDAHKVRLVAAWRTTDVFDERERAVLEYAESATDTPVVVSDELMARLRLHFGDAELVELASWVALENLRSRFNAALGLESQGFSSTCAVPGADVPARVHAGEPAA